MNYSLTGKARVVAKNTMKSKTAQSASVATYANRKNRISAKTIVFVSTGFGGLKLT